MRSRRLFTPESGTANNQEVEEAWCFAGRASWWTVVAGELTAKAFSVPCRGILLSGLYIISFNTEFYWRRGRKKLANKLCVSLVANRTTSHSLFRRRWWLSASHSLFDGAVYTPTEGGQTKVDGATPLISYCGFTLAVPPQKVSTVEMPRYLVKGADLWLKSSPELKLKNSHQLTAPLRANPQIIDETDPSPWELSKLHPLMNKELWNLSWDCVAGCLFHK